MVQAVFVGKNLQGFSKQVHIGGKVGLEAVVKTVNFVYLENYFIEKVLLDDPWTIVVVHFLVFTQHNLVTKVSISWDEGAAKVDDNVYERLKASSMVIVYHRSEREIVFIILSAQSREKNISNQVKSIATRLSTKDPLAVKEVVLLTAAKAISEGRRRLFKDLYTIVLLLAPQVRTLNEANQAIKQNTKLLDKLSNAID